MCCVRETYMYRQRNLIRVSACILHLLVCIVCGHSEGCILVALGHMTKRKDLECLEISVENLIASPIRKTRGNFFFIFFSS